MLARGPSCLVAPQDVLEGVRTRTTASASARSGGSRAATATGRAATTRHTGEWRPRGPSGVTPKTRTSCRARACGGRSRTWDSRKTASAPDGSRCRRASRQQSRGPEAERGVDGEALMALPKKEKDTWKSMRGSAEVQRTRHAHQAMLTAPRPAMARNGPASSSCASARVNRRAPAGLVVVVRELGVRGERSRISRHVHKAEAAFWSAAAASVWR